MSQSNRPRPKKCAHCADRPRSKFDLPITMAFQPIFDLATGTVFAQEALVRGKDGLGAAEVLDRVTEENRYQFDQLCRSTAIEVATAAGLTGALSINFMPNAVYDPATCISHTLWTADKCKFDPGNLIFEFTEHESVRDIGHLKNIIKTYEEYGFRTAIDDFGAGYAGLALLADATPDFIKLDRHLVTGIDQDAKRQKMLGHVVALCRDLGTDIVCEGVETPEELEVVLALGVGKVQGYLLARPSLERLQTTPDITWDRAKLSA